MDKTAIMDILSQAVDSPIGVVVTTTSPELFKRRARQVKREQSRADNPIFDNLQFKTSPDSPETQVWIVQKGAKND